MQPGKIVADRSAKHLTLRELFTAAERQSRDLVTHLDLNFLPKVEALGKLVRPPREGDDRPPVPDVTIRNQTSQVIESEKYTAQLYAQLEEYIRAIDESVGQIVESGG